MVSLSTWLRQMSGAVLAFLLLCLSITPAIDSLLCSSDGPVSVSMDVHTKASATPVSDAGHADEGGAPCLHGHCHHGAAALPVLQQAAAAAIFPGPRHPADRGRAPTIGRQFETIRPPIA